MNEEEKKAKQEVEQWENDTTTAILKDLSLDKLADCLFKKHLEHADKEIKKQLLEKKTGKDDENHTILVSLYIVITTLLKMSIPAEAEFNLQTAMREIEICIHRYINFTAD